MATEAPKIARDGTMETTAKEGLEYLEKESPDLAQKLKDQLKETDEKKTENENGSGDAPPNGNGAKNGDDTEAKIPRDNTMVVTAQEGKEFLEKEGGVNEDAKTRSQEKELNSSKSEEKEATKRSAEDEQNDEADDAKKAKVEENGNKKEEETTAEEKE